MCSESALSNDDRYYENEQQEQNYNNFRYINPITSIIDAISNVYLKLIRFYFTIKIRFYFFFINKSQCFLF